MNKLHNPDNNYVYTVVQVLGPRMKQTCYMLCYYFILYIIIKKCNELKVTLSRNNGSIWLCCDQLERKSLLKLFQPNKQISKISCTLNLPWLSLSVISRPKCNFSAALTADADFQACMNHCLEGL